MESDGPKMNTQKLNRGGLFPALHFFTFLVKMKKN